MHADELGSVIATSNGSGTGTLYNYSPYGEPDATNAWTGSRFRYTGQIMLPQAQLYHYKARVYDPRLGRFLQTDPVGYKDDLNVYAYVRNDPVNETDSSGRCPMCIGALIGAGLELGAQLAFDPGARAAYGRAGQALARGDFGAATRSAGSYAGRVVVSGMLGSVGGFAGQTVYAARTGAVAMTATSTPAVLNATQRGILAVTGLSTAAGAGAIRAEMRGDNPIGGAVEGSANAITSPVPSGTIMRNMVDVASQRTTVTNPDTARTGEDGDVQSQAGQCNTDDVC